MDLTTFAAEVGPSDPVTCVGRRTRWSVGGSPDPAAREVRAPAGIERVEAEELTVWCGAGTPVDELQAALAERSQFVALPPGGTVGGALAVGRSDIHRLGWGPVRDALLQTRVVTAEGLVAKAGGPTVKNVSGFDLCRLLVGSFGTLAFLGDTVLRTRPLPAASAWFHAPEVTSPFELFRSLYRPSSVLWDGTTVWVLLEGHQRDVEEQAASHRLRPSGGPPALPRHRSSVPPGALKELTGTFVAEVGVGVVHRAEPAAAAAPGEAVVTLHRRLKEQFDPRRRLNPGRDPLAG